jgi:hypothetical protein
VGTDFANWVASDIRGSWSRYGEIVAGKKAEASGVGSSSAHISVSSAGGAEEVGAIPKSASAVTATECLNNLDRSPLDERMGNPGIQLNSKKYYYITKDVQFTGESLVCFSLIKKTGVGGTPFPK